MNAQYANIDCKNYLLAVHCIEYFLEIGSINTSEILFILDTIYSTYHYQCIGEICQLVISLSCMDNDNLCIGLVIMM